MRNIIGAAAVAIILAVGCSTEDAQQAVADQRAEEAKDVTVATCGSDPVLGFLKATVSVVNGSSKRSSYSINLTFESADGATKYGTGVAFVTAVEPGQTTTSDVLSGDQPPPGVGEVTCRIVEVDRTSDVG